jgi:hypothetical protein
MNASDQSARDREVRYTGLLERENDQLKALLVEASNMISRTRQFVLTNSQENCAFQCEIDALQGRLIAAQKQP